MKLDRRSFFQFLAASAASSLVGNSANAAEQGTPVNPDAMGMLVDTTECIGCRKCEFACDQVNELTGKPLSEFENMQIYDRSRRMDDESYTVINRYPNPENSQKPIYVKAQCMHCLKPACVSACLVGALRITDNGAVTYDTWKCLGCRYCMVACPFQVPTYEYTNPLTPRVMKCTFCQERVLNEGKIPACADMCPPMALTFGKRADLLKLAHQKIEAQPQRYINHVYGENEVGGTSWLYLASQEFEDLGFLKLGTGAMPALTEPIQHAIFKLGLPPLTLYGLLGAMMWAYRTGDEYVETDQVEEPDLKKTEVNDHHA
jgi:Fe-S-cluster-containing dehydrogenase component